MIIHILLRKPQMVITVKIEFLAQRWLRVLRELQFSDARTSDSFDSSIYSDTTYTFEFACNILRTDMLPIGHAYVQCSYRIQ